MFLCTTWRSFTSALRRSISLSRSLDWLVSVPRRMIALGGSVSVPVFVSFTPIVARWFVAVSLVMFIAASTFVSAFVILSVLWASSVATVSRSTPLAASWSGHCVWNGKWTVLVSDPSILRMFWAALVLWYSIIKHYHESITIVVSFNQLLVWPAGSFSSRTCI